MQAMALLVAFLLSAALASAQTVSNSLNFTTPITVPVGAGKAKLFINTVQAYSGCGIFL